MSNLPAIDLSRLTGRDMELLIDIESATGAERARLNLRLLDRAVEGGLDAIPFDHMPQYLQKLSETVGELFAPKG